jgi:hypothetical protein
VTRRTACHPRSLRRRGPDQWSPERHTAKRQAPPLEGHRGVPLLCPSSSRLPNPGHTTRSGETTPQRSRHSALETATARKEQATWHTLEPPAAPSARTSESQSPSSGAPRHRDAAAESACLVVVGPCPGCCPCGCGPRGGMARGKARRCPDRALAPPGRRGRRSGARGACRKGGAGVEPASRRKWESHPTPTAERRRTHSGTPDPGRGGPPHGRCWPAGPAQPPGRHARSPSLSPRAPGQRAGGAAVGSVALLPMHWPARVPPRRPAVSARHGRDVVGWPRLPSGPVDDPTRRRASWHLA